jgi:hypothetical protein
MSMYETTKQFHYSRWRDPIVKGEYGPLPSGYQFESNESITYNGTRYAIVTTSLPGDNKPPYAVQMDYLQEAGTEPPPDDTIISVAAGDAQIVIASGPLAGTYSSVDVTHWRKAVG